MKILITGGAGFLGSHLSEKYVNSKSMVYVIDDLSNGSLDNLKSVLNEKNFKFIKGDVKSKKPFDLLPKDLDIIFHLAARMESTREAFEENVEGVRNILRWIRKEDIEVKRFIYTSSTRAMGFVKSDKPLDEASPCKPDILYGESKLKSENIIREFGKRYGIKTTIFRPPRIYGPRDWQKTFYGLVKLMKFGIAPRISLTLNLIYVKNLVHALMLATKKRGGTYLIMDGTFRVDEIVNTIEKILGKEIKLRVSLPRQFFKIYSSLTDSFRYALRGVTYSIEKVKEEMGYEPIYDLKRGMLETIRWYRLI